MPIQIETALEKGISVMELSNDNFEAEVLNSATPVVVDFWAAWCGPCRIFTPVIEEISKEFDSKAKFAKLNTDDNQEIAAKYNVMSIPTVLLFKSGSVVATSVGALPKESIKTWLKKNL